jgi:hypothetical protein
MEAVVLGRLVPWLAAQVPRWASNGYDVGAGNRA